MMKLVWIPLVVSVALMREAQAQCLVEKLVPADAAQDHNFGYSVSVSGDWAMGGAYADGDIAELSGAVYVYERQASGWTFTQKLKANDPEAFVSFGRKIAIEGDVAAITAPLARAGGIQFAGALYVFERIGTTWTQVARLTASDASASAHLGQSVAISGTRIVIGTDQEDHAGAESGCAYVFERVAGSWVEVEKLVASDAQPGQFFGEAVDIDGDLCIVGARDADLTFPPALGNEGAAYVFERQGGQWIETARLIASNPSEQARFGSSVACEGSWIFIGATGQEAPVWGNNHGVIYAFEKVASQWLERQQIFASDAASSDALGQSLAIDGLRLVAKSLDDELASSSASVYCFEFDGSSWVETTKMFAPDGQSGDAFGEGLALCGRDLFVGAPFDDVVCPGNPGCNSGSAYLFELPVGASQYGSCVDFHASPCGNPDDFGGCVNSTGKGAVLWACGTSSVALDDLLLEARFLPPSAFGIVFMGPAEAQVALGDGLRVAAPGGGVGLYRFPAQQVGPDGRYVLGPGVASMSQVFPGAGAIQPGDSRRFQLWYRDGQGPCGFGTNASSGVRVDFAP